MEQEIKSGIYKIVNLTNKKIYIGSAKNLIKRWKRHLTDLKNKTHHNIHLQRAWEKYGSDSFIFEIIEYVPDVTKLYEREQHYIDILKPFNLNGYNIGKQSSGGDNITLNPKRTEIILKMSITNKKKWDDRPQEYKDAYTIKISGNGNPNWRNGSSIKYCKCGNTIGYGRKECSNCRDRTGNKNPFYGKKHTKELIEKKSKEQKGKYNGSQNLPIIIDDNEYRSAGEASKILNIPMVTIRWRVQSNNEKFKNYKYKNANRKN